MEVAILLYEGVSALAAVGPAEVLGRVPGTTATFVASEAGLRQAAPAPLQLLATAALGDVTHADVVVVPGGPGATALMDDDRVLEWLRTIDASSTWTAAVCTGSLILASAGLLHGRRATSHWLLVDRLPAYGARMAEERVVFDGKYVTGAGVSAGIDLGLALAGRLAGDDAARAAQLTLEYDPRPPYLAGSPQLAPAALVAAAEAAVLRL